MKEKSIPPKYDIFISYRRVGGAQYARILQLMLSQRGYRVFLDYDELTDGKFGEHIQEAIESAPVFMLVLSKDSLARCVNDGDWVRREIQLAIEQGKHIIPVNPDNSFDGIPADIPADIREAVGTHQHSEIGFGQTLGVTVDYMVKTRIAPKIGERLRHDSDLDVLNQRLKEEDKAMRRHRLFVKISVVAGIAAILALAVYFGSVIIRNNDLSQKRNALIAQLEARHPGLNLMANDTISIEQLEAIDRIFSSMRDVYGDSIRFSAFETSVRDYYTILGLKYDESKALLPVSDVKFGDACQFIIKLNQLINSDETDIEFTLPTKEEWEYAACGGAVEAPTSYAGSNDIDEVAWYNVNSGMNRHPSDGQNALLQNGFGLYDMSGNVAEYTYSPYIDFNDPERSTGMMMVKGGNYSSDARDCEIASEIPMDVDTSSTKVGFRLVLRKKPN